MHLAKFHRNSNYISPNDHNHLLHLPSFTAFQAFLSLSLTLFSIPLRSLLRCNALFDTISLRNICPRSQAPFRSSRRPNSTTSRRYGAKRQCQQWIRTHPQYSKLRLYQQYIFGGRDRTSHAGHREVRSFGTINWTTDSSLARCFVKF